MRPRFWPTCLGLVSIVTLAAEEAPPADLLQNLDFYQNMTMVEDQQFFAMATQGVDAARAPAIQDPPAADTATIHPKEKTDASK